MILYRSSTEDLMEILVRSFLRGPCMRSLWERPYMIWYRSLWEDLVEILLKSPSRGPCIKIFQILCIGACMKALLGCSYEVLVWRSCELLYIVYIEGPAAAAAIMSNLICYCSIATVACIWYIGFLPPQTVWGLSPVQSFDYSGMPILGNCDMSLTWRHGWWME